ncbi:MAG: hypothetical protein H6R17_486 [Proteobacteria bacterium]|nr:hypothetical protein [Pseudomonadota bacterium]
MSISYSTTTVSRRRFMVKEKKQGPRPPAASGLDGSSSNASAGKSSAPESFLRAPYRRPLAAASSPWWTNWLAVTLVNVAVVAAIGGLYSWVGADSEESSYVPRRTMVRTPSPIKSAAAATTSPAPQSSTLSTARQAVASPSTADEIDRAMQDGSRKLVLPSNVAGNCSIGDGGSKDLGRCLAQNGARAK